MSRIGKRRIIPVVDNSKVIILKVLCKMVVELKLSHCSWSSYSHCLKSFLDSLLDCEIANLLTELFNRRLCRGKLLPNQMKLALAIHGYNGRGITRLLLLDKPIDKLLFTSCWGIVTANIEHFL